MYYNQKAYIEMHTLLLVTPPHTVIRWKWRQQFEDTHMQEAGFTTVLTYLCALHRTDNVLQNHKEYSMARSQLSSPQCCSTQRCPHYQQA